MSEQGSNWDIAYKAERKRVVRCFHRHSSETRAMHQASFRLTPNQRNSVGEHFYVHPDFPGIAFSSVKQAALHALDHGGEHG